MMSTHNFAVRPQYNWLETGFVPIERAVLHGLNHFIDFISIKVLFLLYRFQSFRGQLVSQFLPSSFIGRVARH